MESIRTILHPTDFSSFSEGAFQLACSLAHDQRARLLVLHVLERPLVIAAGVMIAPSTPPLSAQERQAVEEHLHRLQPPEIGIGVEHLLEEGDSATAILQIAQERQCDLIVMGTHGRTGLRRLLMGSVAEKVVREAPCPVLTVKTPLPPESPTPAHHEEELLTALKAPTV